MGFSDEGRKSFTKLSTFTTHNVHKSIRAKTKIRTKTKSPTSNSNKNQNMVFLGHQNWNLVLIFFIFYKFLIIYFITNKIVNYLLSFLYICYIFTKNSLFFT